MNNKKIERLHNMADSFNYEGINCFLTKPNRGKSCVFKRSIKNIFKKDKDSKILLLCFDGDDTYAEDLEYIYEVPEECLNHFYRYDYDYRADEEINIQQLINSYRGIDANYILIERIPLYNRENTLKEISRLHQLHKIPFIIYIQKHADNQDIDNITISKLKEYGFEVKELAE